MKEFLKWMQGGLAGVGQAVIQAAVTGHLSLSIVASACATAVIVRAAGWLVQKYGPSHSAEGGAAVLALLFLGLPGLANAQTPKFVPGQSVKTTRAAYVRSSPYHGNTTINVISTAAAGAVGTIAAGPVIDTSSDGDRWARWNVIFTSPLLPGWVADTYLVATSPPPPPPPATVASVAVTPTSVTGTVGQTAQFAATAFDSAGRVMTGLPVAWASTNTGIVTITSLGRATAVSVGTAAVTATISGVQGRATVTVVFSPVVTTVTVTPSSASYLVGTVTQLTAQAFDQNGAVMVGQTFTWASSNVNVATVTSSGLTTGVGAGTALITANAGGRTGQATVTVTASPPPGVSATGVVVVPIGQIMNPTDFVQLYGIIGHSDGSLTPTAIHLKWSSDQPGIASVDSFGVARALSSGTAIITARDSASGLTGTAQISVRSTALLRVKQARLDNFTMPAFSGTLGITFGDSSGAVVGRAICTVNATP